MRDTRCVSIALLNATSVTSQKFVWFARPVFSAARPLSVNQNSRIERFGFFNRAEQTEKLVVISAARSQSSNFPLAQLTAQKQIEKIVVVSRRLERKFASVGGCLAVFRSESRQQIEDVVSGESCSFTREHDRNAQFKEPQAVVSNHATQLFRCFTIKRRLRIDQDAKQARLIFFVERVERELNAIGEKLFKLRFNRIIDPAETADRLTVAGSFHG